MDIGGVPDHVMTLLDGFSPNIKVTLICDHIHPQHRNEAEMLGVDIDILPMQRLAGGMSDLKTLRGLRKILREGDFDILHTHMSKAALLGAIVGVMDRSIKVVNTAHNLGYIALPERWKKIIFWVYDRLISTFGIDATVTVSQIVADTARDAFLIPAKKLHVIQNGIRTTKFKNAKLGQDLRKTILGQTKGPLILTVARLVWFKGLNTLIDALPEVVERHTSTKLVIVGDGELRADLEAQVEQLGMSDYVVFTGERDDVPDLLAAADLFVLPSVSEGLPISILEAMASKLPIVATNVGGIPELVVDGETGLLVNAGDVDGMSAALISLLDDPCKCKAAGIVSYVRMTELFSQSTMVTATEKLYQNLFRKVSTKEKHDD
jgi:glycosyltransferase involved in cell wall biosynthesis